jgi:hypothetical protein
MHQRAKSTVQIATPHMVANQKMETQAIMSSRFIRMAALVRRLERLNQIDAMPQLYVAVVHDLLGPLLGRLIIGAT